MEHLPRVLHGAPLGYIVQRTHNYRIQEIDVPHPPADAYAPATALRFHRLLRGIRAQTAAVPAQPRSCLPRSTSAHSRTTTSCAPVRAAHSASGSIFAHPAPEMCTCRTTSHGRPHRHPRTASAAPCSIPPLRAGYRRPRPLRDVGRSKPDPPQRDADPRGATLAPALASADAAARPAKPAPTTTTSKCGVT